MSNTNVALITGAAIAVIGILAGALTPLKKWKRGVPALLTAGLALGALGIFLAQREKSKADVVKIPIEGAILRIAFEPSTASSSRDWYAFRIEGNPLTFVIQPELYPNISLVQPQDRVKFKIGEPVDTGRVKLVWFSCPALDDLSAVETVINKQK